MEKLSIFIPTCNRAPLLKELLGIVINQIKKENFTPSDLKIYISDNCSSDNTPEVVLEAQEAIPGFIIAERNPVNIGPVKNIAKAGSFPKGEYCWIHSDDELMEPNSLRTILKVLNDEPLALLLNKSKSYDFKMSNSRYENYRDFLKATIKENYHLPLAHTHLTANIFRQNIFNMEMYEEKSGTSYAQMYALAAGLRKSDLPIKLSEEPIMVFRERRADPDAETVKKKMYFDYANIIYRQLDYLKWLKKYFQMPDMNIKKIMKVQDFELRPWYSPKKLADGLHNALKAIKQVFRKGAGHK